MPTSLPTAIKVAPSASQRRASKARVLLVQREHQDIVEAIRNEDAEAACKAMRRYIDNARRRVLSDSVEP